MPLEREQGLAVLLLLFRVNVFCFLPYCFLGGCIVLGESLRSSGNGAAVWRKRFRGTKKMVPRYEKNGSAVRLTPLPHYRERGLGFVCLQALWRAYSCDTFSVCDMLRRMVRSEV